MMHESSEATDGPTSTADRLRLSSRDAAAVDRVLEAGFDPDRLPADDRARHLHSLLGQLDGLPRAGAPETGDPRTDELARHALTETTLAGIDRFERERVEGQPRPLGAPAASGILARIGEPLRFAAAILVVVALGYWAADWSQRQANPGGGVPGMGDPAAMAGVVLVPMSVDEARAASAREETVTVSAPLAETGVVARGTLWEIQRGGGEFQVWFVAEGSAVPPPLLRYGRPIGQGAVRFDFRGAPGPSGDQRPAGVGSEAGPGTDADTESGAGSDG